MDEAYDFTKWLEAQNEKLQRLVRSTAGAQGMDDKERNVKNMQNQSTLRGLGEAVVDAKGLEFQNEETHIFEDEDEILEENGGQEANLFAENRGVLNLNVWLSNLLRTRIW